MGVTALHFIFPAAASFPWMCAANAPTGGAGRHKVKGHCGFSPYTSVQYSQALLCDKSGRCGHAELVVYHFDFLAFHEQATHSEEEVSSKIGVHSGRSQADAATAGISKCNSPASFERHKDRLWVGVVCFIVGRCLCAVEDIVCGIVDHGRVIIRAPCRYGANGSSVDAMRQFRFILCAIDGRVGCTINDNCGSFSVEAI